MDIEKIDKEYIKNNNNKDNKIQFPTDYMQKRFD